MFKSKSKPSSSLKLMKNVISINFLFFILNGSPYGLQGSFKLPSDLRSILFLLAYLKMMVAKMLNFLEQAHSK
eukprot:04779.XXX_118652_118870_1 [CDS] Oithona nana genome sequencing.